jgi:hypothetical protein
LRAKHIGAAVTTQRLPSCLQELFDNKLPPYGEVANLLLTYPLVRLPFTQQAIVASEFVTWSLTWNERSKHRHDAGLKLQQTVQHNRYIFLAFDQATTTTPRDSLSMQLASSRHRGLLRD